MNDTPRPVSAPKSTFIAYDIERMHEILTLNFFRFIDSMGKDGNKKSNQEYVVNFYKKVSQLSEEALIQFLADLAKNMTDTAEFNFYGAHQIDFSTILNISSKAIEFNLNLPQFISDLQEGNVDELRQARAMIPEIFQSYRFVDFLLEKVPNTDARYYLDDLRKQCTTPDWIQYTPLLVPQDFEISWDVVAHQTAHPS